MTDSIVDSGTVVVGVDRRPASAPALDWAVRHAARDGLDVLICHVVARPGRGADDDGEELLADTARAARARLPIERVRVCLCHGVPATELATLAGPAGLLVVGGRERLTWADRRVGSVSLEVAVAARCPLVVVRAESGRPGPVPGTVLVGVDGSPAGRAALRFGFEYAHRNGLPLAAANVARDDPGPYWFDDRLLETHFATEPAAVRLLDAETEPLRSRYPWVPVRLVALSGVAPDALAAASNGARLLVVGNAGAPPTHAPLGPVAYGVLGAAGCPVAVLRPTAVPLHLVPAADPPPTRPGVDGVSSAWG